MKKILLFVALINFVSAKFDPTATPGCEKAAEFQAATMKSCCETYPNLHEPEIMKECHSTCKSAGSSFTEKRCCTIKCEFTAKKLLNSDGELNNEAVNSYIMEKLGKNEAWTETVKKTIDDCVKEAPDMLAKWKEIDANVEKCENNLHAVMKHCVARNLFFNCPAKTSSEKCTELEEFGKSCPLFPLVGGYGARRGGKQKKKKQEEDADDE